MASFLKKTFCLSVRTRAEMSWSFFGLQASQGYIIWARVVLEPYLSAPLWTQVTFQLQPNGFSHRKICGYYGPGTAHVAPCKEQLLIVMINYQFSPEKVITYWLQFVRNSVYASGNTKFATDWGRHSRI